MKTIDILNDEKYSAYRDQFRKQCLVKYHDSKQPAATEIALINRYLNGENTLKHGKDFSIENLELIKSLTEV